MDVIPTLPLRYVVGALILHTDVVVADSDTYGPRLAVTDLDPDYGYVAAPLASCPFTALPVVTGYLWLVPTPFVGICLFTFIVDLPSRFTFTQPVDVIYSYYRYGWLRCQLDYPDLRLIWRVTGCGLPRLRLLVVTVIRCCLRYTPHTLTSHLYLHVGGRLAVRDLPVAMPHTFDLHYVYFVVTPRSLRSATICGRWTLRLPVPRLR